MIEQIKGLVSIKDVLEFLGCRVKNKTACCPIHQDKNPSLSFRNGLWYCFVCGLGGDVITLVEKTQGLSFKDSLSWLNNTFSLNLTTKKPQRNFYLEALTENYQVLKDSIQGEIDELIEFHHRLMDRIRGLHFPEFWLTANEWTFEYTYDDKLNHLEDKLRELENARYKLRSGALKAF